MACKGRTISSALLSNRGPLRQLLDQNHMKLYSPPSLAPCFRQMKLKMPPLALSIEPLHHRERGSQSIWDGSAHANVFL
jgi:hypothetical protein